MRKFEVLLTTGNLVFIEADVMEIDKETLQFWIVDDHIVAIFERSYWIYAKELDASH